METEDEISSLTEEGKVLSACVVEEGGRLVTLIKSLMGNDMGLKIAEVSGSDFCPAYGDIIILTKDKLSNREVYAEVTKNGIVEIGGTKINMEELKEAFKSTLENVFRRQRKQKVIYSRVITKCPVHIKLKRGWHCLRCLSLYFPGRTVNMIPDVPLKSKDLKQISLW